MNVAAGAVAAAFLYWASRKVRGVDKVTTADNEAQSTKAKNSLKQPQLPDGVKVATMTHGEAEAFILSCLAG
jgi:hypothetical protein